MEEKMLHIYLPPPYTQILTIILVILLVLVLLIDISELNISLKTLFTDPLILECWASVLYGDGNIV